MSSTIIGFLIKLLVSVIQSRVKAFQKNTEENRKLEEMIRLLNHEIVHEGNVPGC